MTPFAVFALVRLAEWLLSRLQVSFASKLSGVSVWWFVVVLGITPPLLFFLGSFYPLLMFLLEQAGKNNTYRGCG